jgi:hypothetical protein
MATCPCDHIELPDCLDIPPGLADLPRQSMGFAEFREGLLQSVAAHPVLNRWSVEGEQDLGAMLLEMWAYVLDVTQFYDERITEEFFLLPSKRPISTHRIIKLLGYHPRPALSAQARIVVEVEGKQAVTLPAGTAFRSEAFDDEAPQVFETLVDHKALPQWNRWQLAPIPGNTWPGRLILQPRASGVPRRGMLAMALPDGSIHASRIEKTNVMTGPDERRYVHVQLEDEPVLAGTTALEDLTVRLMGRRGSPSPYDYSFDSQKLVLNGVYPQLRDGDMAVLDLDGDLFGFVIQAVNHQFDVTVRVVDDVPARAYNPTSGEIEDYTIAMSDIIARATEVTLPSISGLTLTETSDWRLYFNPLRVGRPAAPSLTELDSKADLPAVTELIQPRHKRDASATGDFALRGPGNEGQLIKGVVHRDEVTSDFSFTADAASPEFTDTVETPAALYRNLVTAIRGERIVGEVLGSADASRPGNRFKLKKAPLSWIEDASTLEGVRPLLEVFVDGIRWERRRSLYDAVASERIYVLETDAEDNTWVVFGGHGHGARPVSGVNNVTADYSHGAGAAKPPPGSIRQMVSPIKNIKRVHNALRLTGGRDPESPDEIKSNAPRVALTLGRAVSVQDFTALARTYPGVLNVASGWAWDKRLQRASVVLWLVEDGGLDEAQLQSWLSGMAAENTPIDTRIATLVASELTISIDVRADHPVQETRDAVLKVLAEDEKGLLSLRNVPIGGIIYRSAIVKAAHTIAGVASVASIRLDGVDMDWAVKAPAGTVRDFTDGITVA